MDGMFSVQTKSNMSAFIALVCLLCVQFEQSAAGVNIGGDNNLPISQGDNDADGAGNTVMIGGDNNGPITQGDNSNGSYGDVICIQGSNNGPLVQGNNDENATIGNLVIIVGDNNGQVAQAHGVSSIVFITGNNNIPIDQVASTTCNIVMITGSNNVQSTGQCDQVDQFFIRNFVAVKFIVYEY